MSAFYGMVQGNRGAVTRGGSVSSGFKATCQSYDGSVITEMRYDHNNELAVRISLAEGSTSSGYYSDVVFDGTFKELKKLFIAYNKKKSR